MRRVFKSRPSPAIVVAVVALVAALAGTAVAGPDASTSAVTKKKVRKIANKEIDKRFPLASAALGDGSVTTPKLADGAVTTPKLGDGAVTTPKLGDGAVTEPKLGDGAVTDAKLGTIVVRTASAPLPDPGNAGVNVSCQPGEKLLGGGGRVAGGVGNQDYELQSSRPVAVGGGDPVDGDQMEAWRTAGHNETGGGGATTLDVYAICLQ